MSQPLCQLTGFLEVFYIATKQNLSSQEQSKHEPWKIKEWGWRKARDIQWQNGLQTHGQTCLYLSLVKFREGAGYDWIIWRLFFLSLYFFHNCQQTKILMKHKSKRKKAKKKAVTYYINKGGIWIITIAVLWLCSALFMFRWNKWLHTNFIPNWNCSSRNRQPSWPDHQLAHILTRRFSDWWQGLKKTHLNADGLPPTRSTVLVFLFWSWISSICTQSVCLWIDGVQTL